MSRKIIRPVIEEKDSNEKNARTHVKEIIWPVKEVSAGLDDADEGNDEQRH